MKRAWNQMGARVVTAAALISCVALLSSQPTPREQVGPLPGGAFRLNSGWVLDPAGKQIPLDTLPMSTALSPDGKYLLVLNGGYRPPSISVIDTASGTVKSSVPVADAWLGIAFTPKGDRVYVSGGSKFSIFEFNFADGALTAARTFPLKPAAQLTDHDAVGDVALSPDGRLIYAADLYHDSVAVINPQSGMVIDHFKTGRRPYRILFHPDGKSFFVTSWADGTLGHYDTATGNQLARIGLGAHPTDMVWREGRPSEAAEGGAQWTARLFVAAANTNSVFVVGVNSDKELSVVERINVALTAQQPLGMTPSALGLSLDHKRLFVACSDGNVATVVDVSGAISHVEGFIPTGWYPTAVRALPSGTLVVLNGKGVRSYPNPNGPVPTYNGPRASNPARTGYVAYLQTGSASWIPPFTDDQLHAWTLKATSLSAYNDSKWMVQDTLPPIEHVLYIEKENRTYDQVLGDMKEGNGDASLVLFGENSTPNLHKLAREFVLLDNFYVNADVSADGNNWSTAAIAPDYVQKLWPANYAGRHKLYDFEEGDPAALPPAGYLWTNAGMAGLSVWNYGFMVQNKKPAAPLGGDQIEKIDDPLLAKFTNRAYRGFDTSFTDVDRAKVFLADLAQFEKDGAMPRLMVMRLPNDHTDGVSPNKLTPLAMAADNDQAVGMIVEGISKSKFWGTTLVCILEDDAQDGPDHVDSHRSPAFLISPYIKRHAVDSHMYNTTSMLRTIELILGLRPMTQFDAAAPPMLWSFQARPDLAPYTLEKPRIPLDSRNPPRASGLAANMKFDREDQNDDDALNEVLWRAIRKDPPPVPVRSYFGK